jgi:hypothetical protein
MFLNLRDPVPSINKQKKVTKYLDFCSFVTSFLLFLSMKISVNVPSKSKKL